MDFIKYQSIKRFSSSDTDGILDGKCYVFPKIDGTNASAWQDNGQVFGGSRNNKLGVGADNAGFNTWLQQQENIKAFLNDHPTLRLFGEWLVPHTLKGYADEAWRQFYVFDVAIDSDNENNPLIYQDYEIYSALLERYNIKYIKPMFAGTVTADVIRDLISKNNYLMKDHTAVGEGLVIKRYDFVNKYGRTVWAKVISEEFGSQHKCSKATVIADITKESMVVDEFLTKPMCNKVLAKIINEYGSFEGKMIPRLLNTIYYDFINEEMWNIIKKNKGITLNFNNLQAEVFKAAKKHLSGEVF